MVIGLLKIIAIANLLFLANTSTYTISCAYLSSTSLMLILGVLLLGAFSKDIYNYMELNKDEKYKQLERPVQIFSAFSTLVASSFVLLIPKIAYLEANYLDSVRAKFGITITRHWSKEEYSNYIDLVLAQRNLASSFISEADRISLLNKSSNMIELRNSLENLIEFKLTNKGSILNSLLTWIMENPTEAAVTVAVTFVVTCFIFYVTGQLFGVSNSPKELIQNPTTAVEIDLNLLQQGIKYVGNLMFLVKKREEYKKFMDDISDATPDEVMGIKFLLEQMQSKNIDEKAVHNWGPGIRLGSLKDLVDDKDVEG